MQAMKTENAATGEEEEFEIVNNNAKRGVGLRAVRENGHMSLSLVVQAVVDGEDGETHDIPKRSPNNDGKGMDMHVIVVADCSSSMYPHGLNGNHNLMRELPIIAKTSLQNHVFNGSVMTFASHARVVKGAATPERIQDWSKEKVAMIQDQIHASGQTNIDEALSVAVAHAKAFSRSHFVTAILFATDGQPTCGGLLNAKALKERLEAETEGLRVFLVPLAMGSEPDVEFMKALAGEHTMVGYCQNVENVAEAVTSNLRLLNEVLDLFDVKLKVVRDGEIVHEETINRGFVTPRNYTAAVNPQFAFLPGDVITLTHPGGTDIVTVPDEPGETRPDIWKELKANDDFRKEMDKISAETKGMGVDAKLQRVQAYAAAHASAHRSLTQRSEMAYRSLSAAAAKERPKHASVGSKRRGGSNGVPLPKAVCLGTASSCDSDAEASMDTKYRSLCGAAVTEEFSVADNAVAVDTEEQDRDFEYSATQWNF